MTITLLSVYTPEVCPTHHRTSKHSKFTAQMLSLSYLNGDFVRWCCGYNISNLFEQRSRNVILKDWFSIRLVVWQKKLNESDLIQNSVVSLYTHTKDGALEHASAHLSLVECTCRSDSIPNDIIWMSKVLRSSVLYDFHQTVYMHFKIPVLARLTLFFFFFSWIM